jgi:hypothetical protein
MNSLHWSRLLKHYLGVAVFSLFISLPLGTLIYIAYLAFLFVAGATTLNFPSVKSPDGSYNVQLSDDIYCPPGEVVEFKVLGVKAISIDIPEWATRKRLWAGWVPKTGGVGTAIGHSRTEVELSISDSALYGASGTVTLFEQQSKKTLRIIAAAPPEGIWKKEWLIALTVTCVCILLYYLYTWRPPLR